MKKTKEMYANGYYLLSGQASANSCFIENLREAKLFIRLATRYLKGYVKIHEYLLTAEGWMLQVTLYSDTIILESYNQKRIKKGKSIALKKESWRIISEQIRLMLSQYVTQTNRMEDRTGSKVKESYRRYYFETSKEAKIIINKMQNQKIRMIQKKKKYRKIKTHYQIPKKEGKGSVFLCSKRLRKEERVKFLKEVGLDKMLDLLDLNPSLVTKKVIRTLKSHTPLVLPPKQE